MIFFAPLFSQAQQLPSPPSPPSSPSCVRVVERGPPHGRVLVAAQPLLPGQAILEEEPLIQLKSEEFNPPGIYKAFLASPPDVQRQILDLFSPVDGDYGRALRNELRVLRLVHLTGRRVPAEYQGMMEVARSSL